MWLFRVPLVTIVLSLALLPALAHATPPDPSWIPGLYDDADDDDVVVLVTSGTGDVSPRVPTDLEPVRSLRVDLIQTSERVPAAPGASAARPRAPPAS